MKQRKKVFSILLALIMALSMLPLPAAAAPVEIEEITYHDPSKTLSWKAVEDAESYDVRLFTKEGSAAADTLTVTENRLELNAELALLTGTYYAEVIALDIEDSILTAMTKSGEFSYKDPASQLTLNYTYPELDKTIKEYYDKDTELTVGSCALMPPDGKALKEWNTDEKGTKNGYLPGDTLTISEDMTLYAIWGEGIRVNFDANGHGSAPDAQAVLKGGLAAEPEAPTEELFSFVGWYQDKGGKEAFSFEDTLQTDITLYAKWLDVSPILFCETELADGEYTTDGKTKEEGTPGEAPYAYFKDGVLTLKGFCYDGDAAADAAALIYSDTSLQVRLLDENSITAPNHDAILIEGALDIGGEGKLALQSGGAGISSTEKLTLHDASITVAAGKAALSGVKGMEIEACELTASGTTALSVGEQTELKFLSGSLFLTGTGEQGAISAPGSTLVLPTDYWWRTDAAGKFANNAFSHDKQAYIELTTTEQYIPANYTVSLTASPENGGSVEGGDTFEENTTVAVVAKAHEGFKFVRWTEDDAEVSTAESYSFTVSKDCALTAVFEELPPPVTLTAIAITSPSSKTVYNPGENFDPSGMAVIASYSDGSSKALTDYVVTDGPALPSGQTAITISYTEGAVTVTATQAITVNVPYYTITVTNGSAANSDGAVVSQAAPGSVITIKSNTPQMGTMFKQWEVVAGTVDLAHSDYITTTFTMPAENVSVKAVYEEDPFVPVSYDIGVSAYPAAGGSVSGANSYAEGTTATVQATPKAGYKFVRWTENGTTVSTDPSYSFSAIKGRSLVAVFETVNTSNSTTQKTYLTGIVITSAPTKTVYTAGENFNPSGMVVTASYSNGKRTAITGWTVSNGSKLTATQRSVTLSYSEGGITKTATQSITVSAAEYAIHVTNGKSLNNAGVVITKAASGSVVTMQANDAPAGKVFDKWKVTGGGVTLRDPSASTISFVMPAQAVTVTASYKDKGETPAVTPTISGSAQTVTKGDGASFGAGAETGKPSGVRINGKDIDAANYSIDAKTGEVTLTAAYIDSLTPGEHTLTILYADGEASAAFTVEEKAQPLQPVAPEEKEGGKGILWFSLLLGTASVAVAGMAFYAIKKRRG